MHSCVTSTGQVAVGINSFMISTVLGGVGIVFSALSTGPFAVGIVFLSDVLDQAQC